VDGDSSESGDSVEPSSLAFPEFDASEKAIDIADNPDVRRDFRRDELSVSTADEEPIAVESDLQQFHRFHQMAVPLPRALLFESGMAEFIFVSVAFAKRVMTQFQVRIVAIHEQRRSEASAHRDHQFHAVAGYAAHALHVSVIGNAHRAAQTALQFSGQTEAGPSATQIGRRQQLAVPHHSRKSKGNAIESSKRRCQLLDDCKNLFRRGARRGGNSGPFRQRLPAGIKNNGLDSRAPNIDRERAPRARLFPGMVRRGVGHEWSQDSRSCISPQLSLVKR